MRLRGVRRREQKVRWQQCHSSHLRAGRSKNEHNERTMAHRMEQHILVQYIVPYRERCTGQHNHMSVCLFVCLFVCVCSIIVHGRTGHQLSYNAQPSSCSVTATQNMVTAPKKRMRSILLPRSPHANEAELANVDPDVSPERQALCVGARTTCTAGSFDLRSAVALAQVASRLRR